MQANNSIEANVLKFQGNIQFMIGFNVQPNKIRNYQTRNIADSLSDRLDHQKK